MLGRWCAAALLAAGASSAAAESFDNVIVGAGAGGLQLAYYMKKSGRDYVILERGAGAGNTFSRLPRHRNLISINKWNTGSGDPEFNLRHDWNSLLDEEPEPFLFPPYSDLLMPKAWSLVEYLEDYAAHHDLNIQYNVEVQKIHREGSGEYTLTVGHTNSTDADFKVSCKNLVMATGLPVTKVPKFRGMELAESYSDVSVDPALFANKSVLIIGRGNAAFELANNLSGVASHLHIIGRSKQRFAWQTHYVGDLRAVNNDVLDLYQLKSQVAIADNYDFEVSNPKAETYFAREADGKIYYKRCHETFCGLPDITLRIGYDHVINCIGWLADFSPFDASCTPDTVKNGKYPKTTPWYETANAPNMYWAGTLMHGRDHRKSSGGFIHGFRYLVKFLHNTMESRLHGTPWPQTAVALDADADAAANALIDIIIPLANADSAMYQMFQYMYDVFVLEEGRAVHYKSITLDYMKDFFGEIAEPLNFFTVGLEFGKNFVGTEQDVFRTDRVNHEDGSKSNFLHPVLRFYSFRAGDQIKVPLGEAQAARTLHIPEDFVTEWQSRKDMVHTVGELAKAWLAKGLQGVPEGGYEQLLEGYRHPWHVDALGGFLKAAMATTKEACAAANAW